MECFVGVIVIWDAVTVAPHHASGRMESCLLSAGLLQCMVSTSYSRSSVVFLFHFLLVNSRYCTVCAICVHMV